MQSSLDLPPVLASTSGTASMREQCPEQLLCRSPGVTISTRESSWNWVNFDL